mgnify:CR=1 FL=1
MADARGIQTHHGSMAMNVLRIHTWRDNVFIDISIFAMSIMVSVLSTPETREGLLNHSV